MATCQHDGGWVAVKPPLLYVDPMHHVILGLSRINRILLKCNTVNCQRVRFGTFMRNGAFVRLGRSRWAKPGEL